jgi:hypothetical protein
MLTNVSIAKLPSSYTIHPAELFAPTDSLLIRTETAKLVTQDVNSAKDKTSAPNVPTDSTSRKTNVSRLALSANGEIVKKESATNVTMLAKYALITLPPTANTALKDSSLTETLALKETTAEEEPTLTIRPENVPLARFLSVQFAWISILATNASTDTKSTQMEDALRLNLSLISFLKLPSSYLKSLILYSELLKSQTSTPILREPELDQTLLLSPSS